VTHARTDEPLSVLTATSTTAGGPNFHTQGIRIRPGVDELTRLIEREVQSLAAILGVGENDPLDAPLCTIELACERIRGLWPP
jgi:hypothetical protein